MSAVTQQVPQVVKLPSSRLTEWFYAVRMWVAILWAMCGLAPKESNHVLH